MKKTLLSLSLMALAFVGKAQNCSELFISEYVEGTGNNKAIEVYNPTNATINLSNYRLVRYSNGASYANPVDDIDSTDLTGTIAPFAVHILVNGQTSGTPSSPACNPVLQALGNQLDHAYGAPTYMNGDDAIGLVRINPYKIIDIFGVIGERPVTAWSDVAPYVGTTGKWWTKDHSMQRKAAIKIGITSNPAFFNPKLEYDSLPKDNWSKLGSHVCDCFVILSSTVSASSSTVCVGQTVNLMSTNNGGSGAVSYTWAPSSQIQGSVNSATAVAFPSSASTIIYTLTSSDGFTTNTNTISIDALTCAPLTSSVSATSSTVCLTQSTELTVTTSGGSGVYTYTWSPSSEIQGSVNTATIAAKPSSTVAPVVYTVTVNDGTSTSSNTISVQANTCVLPFTPTITATSSTVCLNQTVSISAESTFGGSGSYTYTWAPASEIQGATNTASISAKPTTTSTVVYSVTVSDGVAAAQTLTTTINAIVCDVLVKENTKEIFVKMFPNPNNGKEVTFVSDKNITNITIVNNVGQVIYSEKMNETKVVLNDLNLTKGIYFVIIKNEAGSKSSKLIIQ